MQTGKAYSFTCGALRPLENPQLPIGTVIFYEDRANPRQDFVIVDGSAPASSRQSQTAICLEDGHAAEVSYCNGEFSGHWEFAGRTIPAEELPAALAAARASGERLRLEAEAAGKVRAENRAREKAALLAEFGKLLAVVKPGEYASAAHGSRNLKKHLAAAFQGVKFSVRSETYSGGDSISISWELGPTKREVEEISGRYQEGSFNGMEDIYETDHENQWPDLFGGAQYVQESRHDGEAVNLVARLLCERYGLALPADCRSFWNIRRENDRDDIGCLARRLILRQSYPPGAEIIGIEETGETCGDDILRAVFRVGDKICTIDTAEAKAAHFRARFAEWSGDAKTLLRALAKKTGRDLAGLFDQFNAWTEAQFAAGKTFHEERSLEAFCQLPEFQAAPVAAIAAPGPVQDAKNSGVTVRRNVEKNGIEIVFAAKPEKSVLDKLKANGWRWSRFAGCWYARQTSLAVTFAAKLAGLTDEQAKQLFAANKTGAGAGPDRFDMLVEDQMAAACGLN